MARSLPLCENLVDGEADVEAVPGDDDVVPGEVVQPEVARAAQLRLAGSKVDVDLELEGGKH